MNSEQSEQFYYSWLCSALSFKGLIKKKKTFKKSNYDKNINNKRL